METRVITPGLLVDSPNPDLGPFVGSVHGYKSEDAPLDPGQHAESWSDPHCAYVRLASRENPPYHVVNVWATTNGVDVPFYGRGPDVQLTDAVVDTAQISAWHSLGCRFDYEMFWFAGAHSVDPLDDWTDDAAVYHATDEYENGFLSRIAFDYDGDGDYDDCIVELAIVRARRKDLIDVHRIVN